MNLIEPTVGLEAGPQYALDINSSLTLIDQHDHSTGKGVQITPAGMDINAALSMNNNPLLGLSYESFNALAAATAVVQAVSVAPASSINELWYTDSNGKSTQITANGVVNAMAAAIPGESYDSGTFIWTQTQSSLPTRPANFDIGSITIRPNTNGTTNGVVLGPPAGISSQYNVQLPLIPAVSTGIMTMDTSGNMAATVQPDGSTIVISSNVLKVPAQGIQGSNILDGTVTPLQQTPNLYTTPGGTVALTTSFSTTSSTPVLVTGAGGDTVTALVTMQGNSGAIMVGLVSNSTNTGSISVGGGSSSSSATIQFLVNGTVLFSTTVGAVTSGTSVQSTTWPLGIFSLITGLGGASSTSTVTMRLSNNNSQTTTLTNARLVAYEL